MGLAGEVDVVEDVLLRFRPEARDFLYLAGFGSRLQFVESGDAKRLVQRADGFRSHALDRRESIHLDGEFLAEFG